MKKPGFYIEIDRDDEFTIISQVKLFHDGSKSVQRMHLTGLEAGFLSIALDSHLKRRTRRSIYVGRERS